MYGYIAWPGAYSFKEEISLFMSYCKEQIEEVMKEMVRMKVFSKLRE